MCGFNASMAAKVLRALEVGTVMALNLSFPRPGCDRLTCRSSHTLCGRLVEEPFSLEKVVSSLGPRCNMVFVNGFITHVEIRFQGLELAPTSHRFGLSALNSPAIVSTIFSTIVSICISCER